MIRNGKWAATGTTAIERRGLIALAAILVASVAAIAVWRGDTAADAAQGPAEATGSEAVEAVTREARADSVASAAARRNKPAKRHKTTPAQNDKKKSTPRRSLLDERPD